jgi:hypothetical protein
MSARSLTHQQRELAQRLVERFPIEQLMAREEELAGLLKEAALRGRTKLDWLADQGAMSDPVLMATCAMVLLRECAS